MGTVEGAEARRPRPCPARPERASHAEPAAAGDGMAPSLRQAIDVGDGRHRQGRGRPPLGQRRGRPRAATPC